MTRSFPDHFSACAADYAKWRPRYPADLADRLGTLAGVAEDEGVVFEAGCGSGQLTIELAGRFARVIATDASAEQIAVATLHPRVEYRVARAEDGIVESGIVDLVVAAQAAHWFDLPRFGAAARRAAKPGAAIAFVTYPTPTLAAPACDAILREFYTGVLAGHWPPERRHAETGYATLELPFTEIEFPPLEIVERWPASRVAAYIGTWSAVRSLERAGRRDLYAATCDRLIVAAGGPDALLEIRFPLVVRAGRLD